MTILLNELAVGNAFKTNGEIAFRCKGKISPDYLPIIPIKQYFLISKNAEVMPISDATTFTSSQDRQSKKSINTVQVGMVVWTCNPFGLNQYILVTKNIRKDVMMVAALGEPRLMNASSRIVDLGSIKNYSGPSIAYDQLRLCPNCLNKSYVASPVDEEDNTFLIGECYNCKCTTKISW